MRMTVQFSLVVFFTSASIAAETSDPALFQIRKVMPEASDDTEQMVLVQEVRGEKHEHVLHVHKKVLIDHTALKSSAVETHPVTGDPQIDIIFTEEGGRRFTDVTRRNAGEKLAIIMEGKVHSAPIVHEEIQGNRARISCRFTEREAKAFAEKINRSLK